MGRAQYSSTPNTPSLQIFLPEHLPEFPAPRFELVIARQTHDDDLVVFDVLFEFVIRLRMKHVFAEAAENAL